MAGNSKHKKRVKLRRAAREVKEIEMRRGDAKRLSRSLDRFEAAMFSPIGHLALASVVVRRMMRPKI